MSASNEKNDILVYPSKILAFFAKQLERALFVTTTTVERRVAAGFVRRQESDSGNKWLLAEIRRDLEQRDTVFLEKLEQSRRQIMEDMREINLAKRETLELIESLRRWPLPIQPLNYIDRSASSPNSLNIILYVVDHFAGTAVERSVEREALEAFLYGGAAVNRARKHVERITNVHFYHHVLSQPGMYGDTLRSTLWKHLKTEPTVLIEIESGAHGSGHLMISIAHWGGNHGFDENGEAGLIVGSELEKLEPFEVQLASLNDKGENAETVLALSIASIVVSLVDAYRTIRWPHKAFEPIFPSMLKTEIATQTADHVLTSVFDSYCSLFGALSGCSPLLASELAAKAALVAYKEGQDSLADKLVAKSVELHPTLRGLAQNDDALVGGLQQEYALRGEESELMKALGRQRRWVFLPPPRITHEPSVAPSLERSAVHLEEPQKPFCSDQVPEQTSERISESEQVPIQEQVLVSASRSRTVWEDL